MTCKDDKSVCIIDFHVNNGTKIAITLDPLTFILSPVVGGEGRVRGDVIKWIMFHYFCEAQ
jgi:hypothetical protein